MKKEDEEYDDDDYEDEEYEDDFDDEEEEQESPKPNNNVVIDHSNEFDIKGSSHSVLVASKSDETPHSRKAWYGVDAAESSLHHQYGSDSLDSSNDGGVCIAPEPPMPTKHHVPPPPTMITNTAHFKTKETKISTADLDALPKTVESARGSAALLPYHTQQIRRGHWRLGKKIGSGTFGVVHQGLNDDNGMAVAVKVLKRVGRDDAAVKELENEITLMQKLDHPNIVRYLGCQVDPEACFIFCEWVPCGSLADMIRNYGGGLGEAVLKRYLFQMLAGLTYLHDRLIVHRDLKGGNVLVNEFGEAKLADFGCSKTMSADGTLGEVAHGSIKGTPYFMAPEVIKNERAGRPSDIWSLGGVIYQMSTGEPPWKSLNFKTPVVLFYHVVNAQEPPTMTGVSPDLLRIVKSCFARDPAARPTARELMSDKYFTDIADHTSTTDHVVEEDSQMKMSVPLTGTLQEIENIFTTPNNGNSPPPCEVSSPEPASPATNSPPKPAAASVQEPPRVKPTVKEKGGSRRRVVRKWGVNGYQKPASAPEKNRTSGKDMRPISAPSQPPEVMMAQPKQKSSLSKFKQRFQDPARMSLHELHISHSSEHNAPQPKKSASDD